MRSEHALMSPMKRPMEVLIVEDEPKFRAFLVEVIGEMDCGATGAATAHEAEEHLGSMTPDLLMLDLNLPLVDGMTFLRSFRKRHPDVPAVIVTGFGDLASAREAIHLGVIEFLTKPCHLGEIELVIDRARRINSGRTGDLGTPARTGDGGATTEEPRSLAEIEREAIIAALRANGGNRSMTSEQLGISRRALYNKIEQFKRDGYQPL